MAGLDGQTTRFNSIRDRIATIDSSFFEKIFHSLFDRFNGYLGERDSIVRYDSTMVAISSRLLERGMRVGSKTDKVQLKYTVGMKGSLPCSVRVYNTQTALNENNTIPEAIARDPHSKDCIVVFDRGVDKRAAFVDMASSGQRFVTRLHTDSAHITVAERDPGLREKGNLCIYADIDARLRSGTNKKWTDKTFRIIKGSLLDTGEEIFFLTNVDDMSAMSIADIYKQRWEIEPFFKFLKQHLNATHLVARNTNGIQVMIYITLIAALLLIVYKKVNNIGSLKIARMRFGLQVEMEVTRAIVVLCGGDPSKAPHIFSG